MRTIRLRRPSPALAVSIVALIVALGGTSYAAFSIPKNSVGTKQLQNSAVTTKKIKKGAVTGAKLNLKGVTVPAAKTAGAASVAGAAAALDGVQIVHSAATDDPADTHQEARVDCASGMQAIGGYVTTNPSVVTKDGEGELMSTEDVTVISANGGTDNAVSAIANNESAYDASFVVSAVCIRGSVTG